MTLSQFDVFTSHKLIANSFVVVLANMRKSALSIVAPPPPGQSEGLSTRRRVHGGGKHK